MTIKEIYGSGITLYKEAFSKLWYLVLINVIILNVISVVKNHIVPIFQPTATTAATVNQAVSTAAATTQPTLTPEQMFWGLLINIATIIIASFFFAIFLQSLYDHGGERRVPLIESCGKVFQKYIRVIIVTLILAILVLCGFLLFIVPGIYLAVLLMFSLPLLLFDDKKAFSAISGSAKLVWGNWWRTLLIILPAILLNVLLNLALLPLALKQQTLYFILTTIINTFIYLLIPVYSILIYHDLKLRKLKIQS